MTLSNFIHVPHHTTPNFMYLSNHDSIAHMFMGTSKWNSAFWDKKKKINVFMTLYYFNDPSRKDFSPVVIVAQVLWNKYPLSDQIWTLFHKRQFHTWYWNPAQSSWLGSSHAQRENLLLLFCSIIMVSNCLLNIHAYTHRSRLLSAFVRKSSLCPGQSTRRYISG